MRSKTAAISRTITLTICIGRVFILDLAYVAFRSPVRSELWSLANASISSRSFWSDDAPGRAQGSATTTRQADSADSPWCRIKYAAWTWLER